MAVTNVPLTGLLTIRDVEAFCPMRANALMMKKVLVQCHFNSCWTGCLLFGNESTSKSEHSVGKQGRMNSLAVSINKWGLLGSVFPERKHSPVCSSHDEKGEGDLPPFL